MNPGRSRIDTDLLYVISRKDNNSPAKVGKSPAFCCQLTYLQTKFTSVLIEMFVLCGGCQTEFLPGDVFGGQVGFTAVINTLMAIYVQKGAFFLRVFVPVVNELTVKFLCLFLVGQEFYFIPQAFYFRCAVKGDEPA